MSERVHVVVRIRPFIASDPPDAELNTLVLDPTHVSVGNGRVFKADRVYMMEDATEVIHAESVAPLITRFLRGFNASVLAYGQTGTGKTFTVQSLLPLLLTDIMADKGLRSGAAGAPNAETSTSLMAKVPLLYLQYVEVYGEVIRDLLEGPAAAASRCDGEEPSKIRLVTTTAPGARAASPSPERAGRQLFPIDERDAAVSPTAGCALVGATIVPIFTLAQAAELIARGDTRRATGSTNVHAHSSRSHAILTLFHARYACRLDVVDLAGSEREKKTGNVGVRFQESIAINTGLLALGNVMRALSRIHRAANGKEAGRSGGAGHQRSQHVPYRSSRLTRLLQDTLGGNSATVLIACVAPDTYNRDETLRTLQYCSLALRILNEPLQQYERLRRAQSPLCRRGSPSAAAAVSPLSLREGTHTAAAATRARRDSDAADEPKVTQLKVLELQSAYASLQQQYDEQAEVIASMCASHATTKERLALCERELRKDEGIFTQQIRAMQELVCENRKLRRRLAKACAPTTTAAATAGRDKAAMAHDPLFRGGDDLPQPACTEMDSHHGDKNLTDAVRHLLLAGDRDAAGRMGVSLQLAPSHSQGHRQQHSAAVAAAAATRPPLSAHSPHRPQDVRDGVTDRTQYAPLEELPLAVVHQAGVRVDDGRGGAETPTYPAAEGRTEASHALDGMTSGGAAAPTPAEPAQSFIRYILGLHGIDPEAEQAGGVDGGDGRGRAGAGAVAAAATSLQSSIRKSAATSVGGVALEPAEVSETTAGSSRDGHTRREGAPSPLGDALSRRADCFTASLPPHTMQALSEGVHSSWERQVDRRGGGTDAAQQDGSTVLLLATEVLRCRGTNAELRNQVQVLQAELDGKQREAALLRLELQEMKELFTT
ncbi:putative kinesin [Leishmania major strain Friedlin]|uniref:Putative kinesin n=1 Tax=Leishmania major TaxID=5664 RepID=Q4QIX3_LEIMA|nr:putative kinesin [Leishmania major strain Friedlin]CAG9568901.1 kinesin_-_putative [Leishmania major strain Friedlin]CAJ02150.1 putative kinesin [Leishmania major strain Friedlin]|eukprot:XP_001680875.1 putative kinesin [Leishmania major strain Friedlin]